MIETARRAFPTFAVALLALGVALALSSASCRADSPAFQPIGLGGGGGLFSPAASPHDPNLMFVSCDMSGLYRSTDGGKSWRMLDKRQMRSCISMRPVFHPTDPNVVYAWGNGDLRVSHDKGLTWKPLCAAPPWKGSPLTCLAIDRSDPRLMLAGGDGAYVSTDAGATWTKAAGVAGHAAGAFIFPKGPVLAIGTDKGARLSQDRGKTWRALDGGLPSTAIRGLCGGYDPATGEGLLYCTVPSVSEGGKYVGGVYKWALGGTAWKSAMGEGINVGTKKADQYGADSVAQYRFIDMDETKPETVWVTTRGTGYWPPNHWTVFRTDDAGAHWRYTFTGDPRFSPHNVECGWVAHDLSWGFGGPADGFSVCHGDADVAMYTNNGELFITTDGGGTWHNGFCRAASDRPEGPGQAWITTGLDVTSCWDVVFDPFRPNNVYIGYTDIGFARSEDGGKSWEDSSTGSPWRNTFYRVVADPAKPGVLYAACSNSHDIPHWSATESTTRRRAGGVCESVDYGKTWKPISKGLPEAPCTSIALDTKSPPDARVMYAAMYGKGIYKTTDGGKSWVEASAGVGGPQNHNVYSVRIHPDGTVFCSVTADHTGSNFHLPSSLYRSTDGGKTWTDIAAGLKLRWAGDFDFDPTNSKVIYLTAATPPGYSQGGIYKTTDGGKTWRCLLGDSPDAAQKPPQDLSSYTQAYFVTVDKKNPRRVFFGAPTHGEFVSEDAGATWHEIRGIPFTACQRVTIDPRDRSTIWVSTFGGGVWKGKVGGGE